MYLGIKHLHTTAAALSILFFIVRAFWSVTGSSYLQAKFVRITPHIIDTILFGCGLALAAMLGKGAAAPWLYAKLVLIVCYILVGMYAIKKGPTPLARGVAACIAVAIFIYIVGIAVNLSVASWFT